MFWTSVNRVMNTEKKAIRRNKKEQNRLLNQLIDFRARFIRRRRVLKQARNCAEK